MENNKKYAYNSLGEVLGFITKEHSDVEALAETEYPKSQDCETDLYNHVKRESYIKGYTDALSKNDGWVRVGDVVAIVNEAYKDNFSRGIMPVIRKIKALPEAPKQ